MAVTVSSALQGQSTRVLGFAGLSPTAALNIYGEGRAKRFRADAGKGRCTPGIAIGEVSDQQIPSFFAPLTGLPKVGLKA